MGLEGKEKEETKYKILEQAQAMFMRYGIRSVTMDDIAKELGISKKTIYQYFKDKNELINLFITEMQIEEKRIILEFEQNAKDAINFIIKVSEYFNGVYANSNPAMIYDLEKYYPEACKIRDSFEEQFMKQIIHKNIDWGIQNGLYRQDLDPDFVSLLWMQLLEMSCDERVFPIDKFNLWDIHTKMVDFIMRGMVTLKGFQLLEEYQSGIKKTSESNL